ncbi:basal cell adhesion molecule-like [Pelobates cultripes]|uniref:Basal cell adhesion molecule-like n=1 Tax=Pelobates cultripes TaxID=61616 RepID=A0AAD1WMZ2_PELCU|nr:basal cell adhesion molecule-like [Pelobates cultripes]
MQGLVWLTLFSVFCVFSAKEGAATLAFFDDEVELEYGESLDENAELYISGPEYPVLEGVSVTLECFSSNYTDLSNFTFQKYLQYMKRWMDVDTRYYYRCWYYNLNVTRPEGRLILNINELYNWQTGPYRCISKTNMTDDIIMSENFSIPVTYMHDIYFQQTDSWQLSTSSDVLYVEEGSDLKIKCTAPASSEPEYMWTRESYDIRTLEDTLVLENVGVEDSGNYTCKAQSLGYYNLVKSKSFQLRVMPFQSRIKLHSYGDFSFPHILLYVAIPAGLMLIALLTVFVFVARRHKNNQKKPQISLVYGEKFSPIYKGCVKPINSKEQDTQPLVA